MTSPTLGSPPCSPLCDAAYARFISMCPLLAHVQQGGVVADTLRMQQGHTPPQEQFSGAPAPLAALDLIGINSIEFGKTIDLVFVIPRADGRAMALAAQR